MPLLAELGITNKNSTLDICKITEGFENNYTLGNFNLHCGYCEKNIDEKFALVLNPDSTYTRNCSTRYLHIDCFLEAVKRLDSEKNNQINELKDRISVLQERSDGLDKIKLFQTIAADYGKHLFEFIEASIGYYTKNNLAPISFTNEIDFQKYVSKNLSKIDCSYEQISNQVQVNDGELDLLARDHYGNQIIIEVKLKASYYALAQVLFYINSLLETKEINPEKIRGIIVGVDIHPNLVHAVKTYNGFIKANVNPINIFKFDVNTRGFTKI